MQLFEGVCLVDTTVILAQPRGSRLRADAVYVDRRALSGMVGHGRANAGSWIFFCPFGAGTPQKSPKSLPYLGPPNMRKKCEINT